MESGRSRGSSAARTGGCGRSLPIVALVGAVAIFVSTGRLAPRARRPEPAAARTSSTCAGSSSGPARSRSRSRTRSARRSRSPRSPSTTRSCPYTLDGDRTIGRLRSTTVVIPYDWVDGEPLSVGVTSSTGIQTHEGDRGGGRDAAGFGERVPRLRADRPARRRRCRSRSASPGSRRCGARARAGWRRSWRSPPGCSRSSAFEALSEAFDLQAALPSGIGGAGARAARRRLDATSSSRFALAAARRSAEAQPSAGSALATLVAVGIGLHNLGEGLAIGTSFALGELALGNVLRRRLHGAQRDRGPRDRRADRRGGNGLASDGWPRLR